MLTYLWYVIFIWDLIEISPLFPRLVIGGVSFSLLLFLPPHSHLVVFGVLQRIGLSVNLELVFVFGIVLACVRPGFIPVDESVQPHFIPALISYVIANHALFT